MHNNWPPLVKTKKITINDDYYMVTEIKQGNDYFLKYYWIHGHNVDIVYFDNGTSMSGRGVKQYSEVVTEVVKKFKLDGLNTDNIVLLPPNGDPLIQPAAMYDSSDYHFIDLGELTKLELNLRQSRYLKTKYFGGETQEIKKENICIIQLPLDQKLINYMWNWRKKALIEFLEDQMNKLN